MTMKTKKPTKTTTAAPVMSAGIFHEERALERLMPWGLNPRHDDEEKITELMADIREHGLQDALHVWERTEGDLILKGHRRFRALRALGVTTCKQVVHRFEDEARAFAYLLADHGHTVGLSAEEKVLAVERGVKLGMNTETLAGPMGLTTERVQLLWDIGEGLPPRGREALHDGRLSLATAEVLVRVEDTKERAKALQLVLHDVVTQEPMGAAAARNLIESEFILPGKWAKAWSRLEGKLRKELKTVDGFHFVPWSDRLEYVQGWSGQPQPGFELAESRMPRSAVTHGEQAKVYGVPVYVVAAPQHKSEYVQMVNVRMLRDAMATAERGDGGMGQNGGTENGGMADEAVAESPSLAVSSSPDGDTLKHEQRVSESLRVWLKTHLGAIHEVLAGNPKESMTREPWMALRPFLARLVTNVDAGAFEAWTGLSSASEALSWMDSDKAQRGYLRHPLLLLLCAACDDDSPDAAKSAVREVGAALGVNGKSLDAAVEKALGVNGKALDKKVEEALGVE